MQSEHSPVEHREDVISHKLAGMHPVSWQEALEGKQTLLRLANPSDEILDAIQERFSLDDLHIKDIRNPNHPPHFTRMAGETVHIILRFPIDKKSDEEESLTTSVSILADKEMVCLIWPEERHHRFSSKEMVDLTVAECVSRIIHKLVDHLLQRVYILREDIDEFEDECLADVSKADLSHLLSMRKELSALARLGITNAAVIEKLKIDETYHSSVVLADALEHMHRAAALAESKAEHALNVMQAVQSLLSQRLNDVMKFLAVITVVMTPMGIIAGIFGMNFTHMEILSHPNGFTLSVWSMLLLAIVLAIIFKVRKWW
ncbi:Mg2+ and Co2+ transporter CorA [Mariprofundus ferrinatatus]|uniref:Mg2+ and Co2+ transporter CorA n=1 Tax=Mariprofundus ferrinatatus TaxID=1921087 RepID=A0A2K8L8Y1_9PROT|nr:CorA family divalent cation transporter [Mariprofundus ferrinatatus]ATX81384.1 Mg2+ and Co2+ transporter CorA [Mariprofundus ferrinatatus]